MISDRTLMKISLTMTITGIIALFFITQSLEPLETVISDINDKMAGMNVIVHGAIKGFTEKDGNIFLMLENDSRIDAVVFEKDSRNVKNLSVGMNVTVAGKVTIYKGNIELSVKTIY